MSEVDLPYFREIVKHIDVTRVQWRRSCREPKTMPSTLAAITDLGIPTSLVQAAAIDTF